ncbi:MAG: GGDEF domain-containing protein [Phycisphaerales bacterium]|nr:GGDEF domain-containing protein [Phycisphaerales bacterium]
MAGENPTLREKIEATLSSGGLQAAFQPIVDLRRGEIAGFETLTRLAPGSAFSNPGELFDAAEKSGTLWDLENCTRAVSLEAATRWAGGTKLFLNTTPQVFSDSRFSHAITTLVRNTPGLTPSSVVLEITERSDQQHIVGLDEQVRLVKAAGFEVAIDDVGAGTSGLNRIMALRPHWLKLDRELIEGIHRDRVRQNLIRFFLRFATLSGVKLIAEGIEQNDELATLMDLGVVYGQGYLLGRPGARDQKLAPEVVRFIQQQKLGGPLGQQPDRRVVTVGRFVRPVPCVEAKRRFSDVAASLLRDPHVTGVVVVDGTRAVGWCDREAILRGAAESRAGQPIGFLVEPGMSTASPETTIPDALELASSRDERHVGRPLIVVDESGVLGVVSVGDLLHAAADLTRDVQLRFAPLTGLPGRVLADEHLSRIFRNAPAEPGSDEAMLRIARTHDVALIDVRAFSKYNERMGYELGDELLRRVVESFRRAVGDLGEDVYLAHLGDDRFLVTAPSGMLDQPLRAFAESFDAGELEISAESGDESRLITPRLRIVLLPEASRWIASAHMLYRIWERWQRETPTQIGTSEVYLVTEQSDRAHLRQSA